MIAEQSDSSTSIYVVSDFRAKEWDSPTDLVHSLKELSASAKLHLVDCVETARANLAISSLKPELGIRAAGVPLKIEVAVTNYGSQAAHDVSVQLSEDDHSRPAVTISTIPAGQTAAADFEVRYATPGQHTIAATLPADAVAADNARYNVLTFPESVPVLVVDGGPQAGSARGDAYFLTAPFASNNVAPTGIAPKIVGTKFLREQPLDPYHVVYLLNIDRLDQPEIDALEAYVKAGGGLAIFMGDRCRADFFNTRLYRDGKGIFPVPLAGPTELLVDRAETASDLTADPTHPVFSLFASQPNVDIDKVIIEKYFATDKRWTPPATSTTRIVARLRNGSPLVVEQKFGAGRVLAILTTAAPTWNNLANTPRHILAMLQMAAYLSAARQTDPSRQVGGALEVSFDRAKYFPHVRFSIPVTGTSGVFPVEAAPVGDHYTAAIPGGATLGGIYEAQLSLPDNRSETRRFAYNVAPEEGNLKMIDGPGLQIRLAGVPYHFHRSADAFFDAQDFDRANLSRFVLYLLIALLVGEQLLAYSASYHPTARELALMFEFVSPLLAEVAAPTASSTARYQFSQLQSYSEWWQSPLLALISLAVVAFVIYMYRRDSVELRPGVGVFLAILRIAAYVGLLVFYLDLQKWSEQKELQNSRALVLVDTSISMGLGNSELSTTPADTRVAQVVNELAAGRMLDDLRKTHDVVVWRFDQDLARVASLPKIADSRAAAEQDAQAVAARQQRVAWLRYVLIIGGVLFVLSAAGYAVYRFALGRRGAGWAFGAGATLAAAIAFGALAYLNLDNPDDDLLVLAGLAKSQSPAKGAAVAVQPKDPVKPIEKIDWAAVLKPRGLETRLGECLRQLVSDERSQPVSAVIVFTDGGQNAGIEPSAAIAAARDAKIPIYIVGLGSEKRPVSARIADFAVPPRAYPGDAFTVTADVEARGMVGKEVQMQLLSRLAVNHKPGDESGWNVEGEQPVTLPSDGKKERIKFELAGIKEMGRRTLRLKIKLPASIKNVEQRPSDWTRDADLEIVDRKNRVLLLAGGPTREYQFLRNQLRRDRDTIVDVMLQTATSGVSQDAHQILEHFPASMKDLAEYDAIVAFDPDWQHLEADIPSRDDRVNLLERWVSEEAGGLVLIAGPVYTDLWAQDPQLSKIRNLYPVEFNRLLIQAHDAKYGGDRPGAIDFTREGQEAEFLWLDSSAAASQHVWGDFKGVFGYYRVKGKKAGATVYSRFADPDSETSGADDAKTYMAGQLYGSGRVFYLGSGEMWRLRALEETHFEQFYTKLLRHVTQGRLLRGSRRGHLAVDRDTYLLGATVEVDARLTDVQHQPLNAAKVIAQVTPQEGPPIALALLPDATRKGSFHGQFPARPGRVSNQLADSRFDGRTARPSGDGKGARSRTA